MNDWKEQDLYLQMVLLTPQMVVFFQEDKIPVILEVKNDNEASHLGIAWCFYNGDYLIEGLIRLFEFTESKRTNNWKDMLDDGYKIPFEYEEKLSK
ncbi:11831_t:CDS:2, partial [Funneliformis mosseae]